MKSIIEKKAIILPLLKEEIADTGDFIEGIHNIVCVINNILREDLGSDIQLINKKEVIRKVDSMVTGI